MKKLYVGNLPFEVDDSGLGDIFSQYGNVLSSKVVMNSEGKSRGFGFVEFDDDKDAMMALELNNTDLDGRKLTVNEAKEKVNEHKNKIFESEYKEGVKNLYVGNLSYSVNNEILVDIFTAVGVVKSAKVIIDKDSERSKGYAFVEMETSEGARLAIETLNEKEFFGRKINVNSAREKTARTVSAKK